MNAARLVNHFLCVSSLALIGSLGFGHQVWAQTSDSSTVQSSESRAVAGLDADPEAISATGPLRSELETQFLPPPNLSELTDITKAAIVSPRQRKTNRRLVISLAQRRVYVYEKDDLMVSYPVAIGKDGWETPKGTWKVDQMIHNPSWQHPWTGEIVPPGPDNPLGRRWIGFWNDGVNAIGFHGTPNENLVGQAVSHGCVRMKNAHIEAMFKQIAMGATVEVR